MYSEHNPDDEGEQVAKPVSITEKKRRQTGHLLDIEILQNPPGVSQIQVCDERRPHVTLEQYRRYPHIETPLSKKCLYATLYCQICRFEIRCSEIEFFDVAAPNLITDMTRHGYAKDRLRSKLHNLRKTLFKKSPIEPTTNGVHGPVVRYKYWSLIGYGGSLKMYPRGGSSTPA